MYSIALYLHYPDNKHQVRTMYSVRRTYEYSLTNTINPDIYGDNINTNIYGYNQSYATHCSYNCSAPHSRNHHHIRQHTQHSPYGVNLEGILGR